MGKKTMDLPNPNSKIGEEKLALNIQKIIAASEAEPRFYHENFLFIRDKDGVRVPLKYNNAQKIFYRRFMQAVRSNRPVRIIVLKARKVGISTLVEAEVFRRTIHYPGKRSKIVSHEKTSAQEIFNMNKFFLQNLPPEIRPMVKWNTKEGLTFDNPDDEEYITNPGLGSSISIQTAKTVEGGRGGTNQFVHFSEFAFYNEFAEKVYTSLIKTMGSRVGTIAVIESTANGEGGMFYDTWVSSIEELKNGNEPGWIPIFIPWIVDKDCRMRVSREEIEEIRSTLDEEEKELIQRYHCDWEQLAWRRWEIKYESMGNIEKFHQECPVNWRQAFVSRSSSAFNKESLKQLSVILTAFNAENPPEVGYLDGPEFNQCQFVKDHRGNLTIWKKPEPGMMYFIGGDPCQGRLDSDDPDYGVLEVFNQNFEQCAEWRGIVDPTVFAYEAMRLGFFYNTALLNIEVNTAWGEINNIKRFYPHIYHWEKYESEKPHDESKAIMFETTGKSVHFLRERLLFAVNLRHISGLRIYSPGLLSEMKTFEWHPGTGVLAARGGCKDDRVVAMGLAFIAMTRYDFGYPGAGKGTGIILPKSTKNTGVIPSEMRVNRDYPTWYIM